VITLVDVKNALHVIPAKFVASGHDYRKDLARFVSLAYDLPIDAERWSVSSEHSGAASSCGQSGD